MGQIGRAVTLAVGLAGGTLFSQAPEFAQQYRQRIGGAIDELKVIVDDFTKQAADHHLDRQQALDVYARSPDDFLRDRGLSMRSTLERYERLVTQQSDLGSTAPVARPFVLMRNADEGILANTWHDFVLGVPVSFPGLAWAAIGFIGGWIVAVLFGIGAKRAVQWRPGYR
ncbi:hypothetical protein GCM10010520_41980 [Rhizobium viscosum]|uniref:DUF2937 family protein n=1 Tax=Rhizobium viscosum TaxID=1673 RepID=A0ABR9IPB2_RHIVS|nr:DUF2937 family protein [Rhizobium viscosum]MBE1505031.1 hypothetical protein [Rhizobium viscosum]